MAERAAAVKNLIVQAQKLDAGGDEQGANRHYLLCVQAISQLLQSVPPGSQGELPQQKTKQLYQMAKQCLERSESLTDSLRAANAEAAQRQRASSTVSAAAVAPVAAPRRLVVRTGDPSSSAMSSTVQTNHAQPSFVTTQLSAPQASWSTVPKQPHMSKQVSQPSYLHSLSPTQAAALKNRLLMEQYQAHLRNTSSSQVAPSFLGLEHLRRLNENMSVARIQEQAIAQKQKLYELTAQHLSKSSAVVRLDALSIPELCAMVSKYNQEHEKLTSAPNNQSHDSMNVYDFVNDVFSSSDHPLTRLMGECQNNILAVLKPVVQAVHNLNGLPYIEIRLAEKRHTEHGGSQSVSAGSTPNVQHPYSPEEDIDAHLDLLCGEDEPSDVAGERDCLTQPVHQALTTETQLPTSQAGMDIMTEKLDKLRKALLGDSGGEGEAGEAVELDKKKVEPTKVKEEEAMVDGACTSQLPIPTEGSYCLLGPEVISHDVVTTGDKDGRMPAVSSGASTTSVAPAAAINSGASSTCVPINSSTHSTSITVNTTGSSVSMPASNSMHHSPDSTRGGPDSVHNSNLIPFEPDITPAASPHHGKSVQDPSVTSSPQPIGSVCVAGPHAAGSPGIASPSPHAAGSPGAASPSPQTSTETLGHYAMLGPEAKVGVTHEAHVEEEPVVFKNLPPLTCTLHVQREAEMVEMEKKYRDVLKDVFKQIHTSLDKLEAGFTQAYPWMATDENTEYCQAVIEANFFPVIMPYLLVAFRCIKYTSEMAVARSMCQHVNATPKDLSVRKKFWLLEQAHAPFGESIEEVRQISQAAYLSPKVSTLVRMSKTIVQCIEGYYKAQGISAVDLSVGVDDMLPIMTYIILRSAKPDLVSECALMEEFIQEGYMKGEEGFCLTSFRTALLFIAQMSS